MRRAHFVIGLVFVMASVIAVNAYSVTYSGDFAQSIPVGGVGAGWMTPVTLAIDNHFEIKDLNVGLTIEHSEVSDLRILVDSPWGQTVVLKESWEPDWRSPRANMTGTVFDDEALLALTAGAAPYTGVYQPLLGQSLSAFNGHDAFGFWTLRIEDVYYSDFGTLEQWSMIIETPHLPEPGSVAFIAAGMMLVNRRRKNIWVKG